MENSCRDFLILSLNFVDKFFNDGLGDVLPTIEPLPPISLTLAC
jgi:hypothetical protein